MKQKSQDMSIVVFVIICIAVAIGLSLFFNGSEPQQVPANQSATTTTSVTSTPVTTGDVLSNGHPVGTETLDADQAVVPLQKFSDITNYDPGDLEASIGRFVQSYYGFDVQDIGVGSLPECVQLPPEPSSGKLAQLTALLEPLRLQFQAARDKRLDVLVQDGLINDAVDDEFPVLSTLKAENIQRSWTGLCAIISGQGFITAELRMDQLVATSRAEDSSKLYFRVPVKRTVTLRELDTTLPLDSQYEPELKTEWHFQDDQWVLMSYAPE